MASKPPAAPLATGAGACAGAATGADAAGADVVAFNKGDGADVINASAGSDDTLTVGGGLSYTDLKLKKTGLDLILDASNGDQITFKVGNATYTGRVSGNSITGTIAGMVIVKVDSGYSGNPGHAGTGTIVKIVQ